MSPPESIPFGDAEVACWTHEQLTRLSKLNLKQRAMNLRDQVGANRLPPLRLSAQPPEIIRWMLVAQCAIAEAAGIDLTLADWGAPKEVIEDQAPEPYFGPKTGEGYQPPARQAPPPTPPAPYATIPTAMPRMPPVPPLPSAPYAYLAEPPPPSPPYASHAVPPYGYDESAVPPSRPQSSGRRPQLHEAPAGISSARGGPLDAASFLTAHEDAAAGMRAARLRNSGASLVLGGDASWANTEVPPSRGGPPVGGYQHYTAAEQRPGSAASTQAYEDSASARERTRAKNRGTFAFG